MLSVGDNALAFFPHHAFYHRLVFDRMSTLPLLYEVVDELNVAFRCSDVMNIKRTSASYHAGFHLKRIPH